MTAPPQVCDKGAGFARVHVPPDARETIEAILDAAEAPTLILDREFRLRQANAAFYRILDVPREAADQKRIDEVEGLAGILAVAREALAAQSRVWQRDVECGVGRVRANFIAVARPLLQSGTDDLVVVTLKGAARPDA